MSDGRRNGPPAGGAPGPVAHLIEEGGATADALILANERAEPLLGEEARAWAALRVRRAKPRRWVWPSAITGAAAMAALLVVAWLLLPRHPSGGDATSADPFAGAADRARPAPPPPQAAPSPLRTGEGVMGGVRVRLSEDGHGDLLAASDGGTTIALEHGTLEVDARRSADHRKSPRSVLVRAGAFSIAGDDAHFTVTTRRAGTEKSVTVAVHDGRAGISSTGLAPIWVYAGDLWLSPPPSAKQAPPRPRPAAAKTPKNPSVPGDGHDCLRLASAGGTDTAISCFEAQSREPGLAGELALVELARLRRDLKGDIAGAERALADYDRLFPRGSLAAEAGSTRIELLLQLGRVSEALAQADRLPGGEASFWRGVCLARLGRPDEARRALDDYLRHPGGTRRAEALRRRRELGP